MKMILLFIILLLFIGGGYWLYKQHFQNIKRHTPTTQLQNTKTAAIKSSYIHSHEYDKFGEFIREAKPSGIIIIISDIIATGQDVCGDKKRRHNIIIVNKSNPHLVQLNKWGINSRHLFTPYTVILSDGNIIIQAAGIICTY